MSIAIAANVTATHDAAASRADKDRIAAVIVTYFAEAAAIDALIDAIQPQVGHVIVVDNTPAGEHRRRAPYSDAVQVIATGRNGGLAAAQNRGIELARTRGAQCVLLLDQDSVPAPDMVATLFRALIRRCADGTRVAAVGPRWRDRHGGGSTDFVRVGWGRMHRIRCDEGIDGTVDCDALVASGCLMPLDALDVVGPMDESLFIDQIDTEWGIRAQTAGYRLIGACDAVLYHGIGEGIVRPWFARSRRMPVHAPLRDYYLIRNSIAVFFFRRAPWRWRLLQLVRLPAIVLVIVTQMPPRALRLQFILRGIVDGVCGRLGPAPESLK